jgi:hypothetical protein
MFMVEFIKDREFQNHLLPKNCLMKCLKGISFWGIIDGVTVIINYGILLILLF